MNFREHVSCGRWKCMAVGGGRHGEPRTGVRGCGALFGVRGLGTLLLNWSFCGFCVCAVMFRRWLTGLYFDSGLLPDQEAECDSD